MNERAVWYDMLCNTTVDKSGQKDVSIKSAGHEKICVSVCFTTQVTRKKLKPFIVFRKAKQEPKALNNELGHTCVIKSNPNACMNKG